MGKSILFLSFVALGLLVILSVLAPGSSAMWLASTSVGYDLVRIALMTILFALLITNPPRNKYFRYLVGIAAVLISAWSLNATYHNHMQFLDSTSILAASISMGIVALEFNPAEEENKLSDITI